MWLKDRFFFYVSINKHELHRLCSIKVGVKAIKTIILTLKVKTPTILNPVLSLIFISEIKEFQTV